MTTDLDTDLLPDDTGLDGPAAEDAHDEGEAIARIESLPRRLERTRRRKVPEGLAEPAVTVPVHLRTVSLGRPVANVSATLVFVVSIPRDFIGFMGEHAYAAIFADSFLGEGFTIKEAPPRLDADGNVTQKLKMFLPRWDSSGKIDQITRYIAPLLPDIGALEPLLGLSVAWRLNVTVDIEGSLSLHPMQESWDLTAKAE